MAEVALELPINADGLLGLVMLTPQSQAGHLENPPVAASARGRGFGPKLVQDILQDVGHEGHAMVSLTIRITSFFSPFGFQPCGQLADGFTTMLILLPDPAVSEPLA